MTDSKKHRESKHRLGVELWTPEEMFGWTWLRTMEFSPETYSLLDADGELSGCVYERFGRVICWAPFTWAEEAYRSEEDIHRHGFETGAQRLRHLEKIGAALREWVGRKRKAGVDLALLRDTHAYFFEAANGIHAATLAERKGDDKQRYLPTELEEKQALPVGGWTAVRNTLWCYESYRLRDASGQMRGQVQIRYGVVRAVAARKKDADEADPLRKGGSRSTSCRGQIVLQEKTRPMAGRFEEAERGDWLRKAVDAIRATPRPDRSWPAETLGAKGTPRQKMFPPARRDWV